MTYPILTNFTDVMLFVVKRQGGLTAKQVHHTCTNDETRLSVFPNDEVSQTTLARIQTVKQVQDALNHLAQKEVVRKVTQHGGDPVFFYQDTPANRPVSTAPRNKTIRPAPEVDVVVTFIHMGTKYNLPLAVVKAIKEFAL